MFEFLRFAFPGSSLAAIPKTEDSAEPEPPRENTAGSGIRRVHDWLKPSSTAADAGWTLSGSVIGCLLMGYAIGAYFGHSKAGVVTGLFVGIVVGMYNLAKIMWRKP